MKTFNCCRLIGLIGALVWMTLPQAAGAQSVEAFYKGKKITMLIGVGPGGGYDRYARVLGRHMGRFIPGNPSFVPKNMPGAGGLRAANYLYASTPKDGTFMAAVQRENPLDPLIRGKKSGAKFDSLKFNWIGSINVETIIAIAWHTAPVKTYKDLYTKELIIGATGATGGGVTTARLVQKILGFKFRIIAGYPGANELDLAMERGETNGRGTYSWSSFKRRKLRWLKQKKVNILYQMGQKKHRDLPDIPLLLDLVKTATDREVLAIQFTSGVYGRPFVAAAGIPKERVAALRAAFDRTMKDQAFLAAAKKRRLAVNPVSGKEMLSLITKAHGASPEVLARLSSASKSAGKIEMAKLTYITVSSKIVAVKRRGRRITFKVKGKIQSANISGRSTKVTLGGKKVKGSKLKPGMDCTITYLGNRRQAKKIDCLK